MNLENKTRKRSLPNSKRASDYKTEKTSPDFTTPTKSKGVKPGENGTKGNGRYANQQNHGNWESSRQKLPGQRQTNEKPEKTFPGSKDSSTGYNDTRKTDFHSLKKDGEHRVPSEYTSKDKTETPSQYITPSLRLDHKYSPMPESKMEVTYPSSNNVPSVSEIEADLLAEQWDSSEETELLNDEDINMSLETKQTTPPSAIRDTSLAGENGTKERVAVPARDLVSVTYTSEETVVKEQHKVQLEDLFSRPVKSEGKGQNESHTFQDATLDDQQSLLTWNTESPLPSIEKHNAGVQSSDSGVQSSYVGVQLLDAVVQRSDDNQHQTLFKEPPDVVLTNKTHDMSAVSDSVTESFNEHLPPNMSTSEMLHLIVNSQFAEQDVFADDLSSLLPDQTEASQIPSPDFPLASKNDSTHDSNPTESNRSLSLLEAAFDSHEGWQTEYLEEAAMDEMKSPLHLYASKLHTGLPLEEEQLLSNEVLPAHNDLENVLTDLPGNSLRKSRLIAGLSLTKPTDDESQLGRSNDSTVVTALQSNLLEAGWFDGDKPSMSEKEGRQASSLVESQLQQDSLSSFSSATPTLVEDESSVGHLTTTAQSANKTFNLKDIGSASLSRMLGVTTSHHSESIWSSDKRFIPTDCQSNSSFEDPAIVQKVHQDKIEDVASEVSNDKELLGEDTQNGDLELNSSVETDPSNRNSVENESLKSLQDDSEPDSTFPHLVNSVNIPEETDIIPEGPRGIPTSDSSDSFFSSEEEEITNIPLAGSDFSSADSLDKVVSSTASVTQSSNSLELFPSAFPSVCEPQDSNQDPNMDIVPPGFAKILPEPDVHTDVFTTPPQSPDPVGTYASLEDCPYLSDEDKHSDEGITFTASELAQSSGYEDQTEVMEEFGLKLDSTECSEVTKEGNNTFYLSHAPEIHESETQILLPSLDEEIETTTELMNSVEGDPLSEGLFDQDEYFVSDEELRATLKASREHRDDCSSAKQESDLMFLIGCFPDLEPSYLNQLLKKCGDNVEDALSIALVSMATPVTLERNSTCSPGSQEEFEYTKEEESYEVKLSPDVHHPSRTFAERESRIISGVQSMCDLPSARNTFESQHQEEALCVNDEVLARVLQEQLDLEASTEESSSKYSPVPSTRVENHDREDTAAEVKHSPDVSEDDNLVLTLSASFAKQLQALFGAVEKHLPHEGKTN